MIKLRKTFSIITVIVLLCSMFSVNAFARPAASIENMTDIEKTHWSYPAVEKCMQEGILRGDSETTFAPDRNMTRAEFTQMVYNRYKDTHVMKPIREVSFADVGKDEDGNDIWFKQSVSACANAGIINGVGDNRFDPDGFISRQDAILILMRVKIGSEGIEKIDIEKKLAELKQQGREFSDIDKIDGYAKKAVIGSIGIVIDGNDDGTINPLGNIIRCEAAQMMYNYLFVYDESGEVTKDITDEISGEITDEKPGEVTPEFIDGDYYRTLSAPDMTKFVENEWKEFKKPQFSEGTNDLKYSVIWDKQALYLAVLTGDKTVQTTSSGDSAGGKTDGFYMYLSGAGEALNYQTIKETQHGARIWFQKNTGDIQGVGKGISGGGAMKGTKIPADAMDKMVYFYDKDAAQGQIWTFKFPWKEFFGMTNEVEEKDYVGIDFVYQDGEGGTRHSYSMTVNFNCATLENELTRDNGGIGTLAGPFEYKPAEPDIPVTREERFVFLGDSITRGYGLDSPDTERFSETFTKTSGIDSSANYAVDGAVAQDLLSKIKTVQVKKDIENSSHVSITIGGNDVIAVGMNIVCGALGLDPSSASYTDMLLPLLNDGKRQQVEDYAVNGAGKTELALAAAKYKNTLRQIISFIRSVNPDSVIYIQTVYNPVYESTLASKAAPTLDIVMLKFNEMIKSVADETSDVHVVDIYDVFYARKSEKLTRINEFDIHPNKKGHDVIAEEYLKLYDSQKK